jgi:hypothetical protein
MFRKGGLRNGMIWGWVHFPGGMVWSERRKKGKVGAGIEG